MPGTLIGEGEISGDERSRTAAQISIATRLAPQRVEAARCGRQEDAIERAQRRVGGERLDEKTSIAAPPIRFSSQAAASAASVHQFAARRC